MSSPQQIQWQDVQQILDASGQPIQQVPFAQYVVNIGAVQGGALNFAASGQRAADRVRPLRETPRVLPRPVPGFLDRAQEQGQIGQALARGRTVDIHGPDGAGKTSLISQAMHGQLPSAFPDGTVYLRAEGEAYDDLLQDLLKQFYDVGQEPARFTENEVRRYLAKKRAVVAVDDANDLDEDSAEALLQVVPNCALLVAGREQRLWQGTTVTLGGLPRDEALALFERNWGQVTPQDRPTMEAICEALGDVPKALVKTARMAAQRGVSLAQVLQEVRPQPERQDPMGQAAWMLGFHLSEGERRTLAGLAAPGGPTLEFDALAYITQIADAKLQEYLVRLQKLDLVHATDGRYGLDEGLRPHVERLGVDEEMRARAAHYYLQRAGALRPHSKDPDEENVLAALDYFYQRRQWREVIQIARATDRYLATAGRWGQWRRQLDKALYAARQSGDRAAEAWAQNQLGVVAVGAESAAVARGLFRGALSVWRALGDRQGTDIARWNLQMLGPPPPPPRQPRPEGEPGGGGSALPVVLGIAAAAVVLVVGVLIGVAVWDGTPTPAPVTYLPPTTLPPPPTTAVPPTTVAPPPTTVVPPRIDLGLAAGCGEVFEPGQNLGIQVWSNVDGTVGLSWVNPDGQGEFLFDVAVGAGETTRQDWDAPEADGRWLLVAELADGQVSDECMFNVESRPDPQVQIWLEEGCGATYDPGQLLTIRLRANVEGSVAVYAFESRGKPDLQFREEVRAGQTAARSWQVPDAEGTWVLRAELAGTPAIDDCNFVIEEPQVQIWLDGSCGQEYEPGSVAQVSLWSSRSGQVDVYLLSDGQRIRQFGESVVARQTASRSWAVGEVEGTWALEADLNDGQAMADCDFSVAAESTPPIVEDVWIPPDEEQVICPGDEVMVYAMVLDDSGLARVELVSRPPGGYWTSASMEVIDDQTYRGPLLAAEKPGTEFYIYAEDVYGNAATSIQYSYAVPPCATVVYDFVAEADSAYWFSTAPDYPGYYSLSFPGADNDHRGFALWRDDPTLEDGSRPGHRTLETHPSWITTGQIQGMYNLLEPADLIIQPGDRFVARVGFLYGAGAGDVTFRLRWRSGDPDSSSVLLASLSDTYDGVVRDWEVPLDSIAGSNGYFYLVVDAGEVPDQDWAVWVYARIERP